VKQPPNQDHCSDQQYAERLIAAKQISLPRTPGVCGGLFEMRLDARVNQKASVPIRAPGTDRIGQYSER
jgi:hypothetical protein